MPEGMRWKSDFSPLTTRVCPALFPPVGRTIVSENSEFMSTIFPLPSSPHWAPSTMTLFTGVLLLSSENQILGVHDVRKLAKLGKDVLGDGVVHVDERNGGSADLGPAQSEARDVDPLLPEECADS